MNVAIVIPTIGRLSLATLLSSLAAAAGPSPDAILLVDDRRDARVPLALEAAGEFRSRIRVIRSFGSGPAAARNRGWRAACATWIAFLDDDVVVSPTWHADLARDLASLDDDVAASEGIVHVPLPAGRAPTDWERNVAGLEHATWITADCAYRRADLIGAGGFDERFRHAFREDADLALRVVARGRRMVRGTRRVDHPVGPARWDVSIRLQRGNADDLLMHALHGADWRERARAPRGAFRSHVATISAAAVAMAAGVAWVALTARFAWQRIAPGPRTMREIATMIATSTVIPFAAVAHRLCAVVDLRRLLADRERAPHASVAAVLFDRDGTLVVDVPYNGDPQRVVPMPGAFRALERLRAAGMAIALVTNQSGMGDGRFSRADGDAVNDRVDALIGPLGPMLVCPHSVADACACRKPQPALVLEAAWLLGVAPHDCVVIGDIGSDMEAARNAGARAILVPTTLTRRVEIDAAPCVAASLEEAVDRVLTGAV